MREVRAFRTGRASFGPKTKGWPLAFQFSLQFNSGSSLKGGGDTAPPLSWPRLMPHQRHEPLGSAGRGQDGARLRGWGSSCGGSRCSVSGRRVHRPVMPGRSLALRIRRARNRMMRGRGTGELRGSQGWAAPSQPVGADCSETGRRRPRRSQRGCALLRPRAGPDWNPPATLRKGLSSLFCVLLSDARFPTTRVLCHLLPKS